MSIDAVSTTRIPNPVERHFMALNRDHDRAHLRDMIDVGLIDRSLLPGLPSELADRLARLLTEQGRGD